MATPSNPPAKRRIKPSLRTQAEAEAAKQNKPIKPKKTSKVFKVLTKPLVVSANFLGRFRVLRFIGRIIWPSYFRNSFSELRLVTWPNRRETRRLTTAVILFSVVFGAFVASLDYGLSHLFKLILIGKH